MVADEHIAGGRRLNKYLEIIFRVDVVAGLCRSVDRDVRSLQIAADQAAIAAGLKREDRIAWRVCVLRVYQGRAALALDIVKVRGQLDLGRNHVDSSGNQ